VRNVYDTVFRNEFQGKTFRVQLGGAPTGLCTAALLATTAAVTMENRILAIDIFMKVLPKQRHSPTHNLLEVSPSPHLLHQVSDW
jgi:hypothetical protein